MVKILEVFRNTPHASGSHFRNDNFLPVAICQQKSSSFLSQTSVCSHWERKIAMFFKPVTCTYTNTSILLFQWTEAKFNVHVCMKTSVLRTFLPRGSVAVCTAVLKQPLCTHTRARHQSYWMPFSVSNFVANLDRNSLRRYGTLSKRLILTI